MKRYGNLYDKVADSENLKEAIRQASKGKRNKKQVKKIIENQDFFIMELQAILLLEEFEPAFISEKEIIENGKKRTITSTPFYPDQIIHWALMLVMQPIILGGLYEYSLATIKGRGSYLGKKVVEKWIRADYKNTKYTLKMDVNKFYPSINHEALKSKLKNKFKDTRLLNIMFKIIDSYKNGLPLGLYTSQWLANFYLSELDHKIKNDWGAKYYVRYMDDLVIFGPNKKKLHKMHNEIAKWITINMLTEKKNWQVFKTSCRPVDFLGYKFYRDHTTIRRKNALKIMRRARKIHKKGKIDVRDARTVISYWGWIKNTDSYSFYQRRVKPYVNITQAKKILSEDSKNENICRDTN